MVWPCHFNPIIHNIYYFHDSLEWIIEMTGRKKYLSSKFLTGRRLKDTSFRINTVGKKFCILIDYGMACGRGKRQFVLSKFIIPSLRYSFCIVKCFFTYLLILKSNFVVSHCIYPSSYLLL